MKKSDFIAVILMLGLIVSGCISTTSGTPAPEADEDDAAELNYQLGARATTKVRNTSWRVTAWNSLSSWTRKWPKRIPRSA